MQMQDVEKTGIQHNANNRRMRRRNRMHSLYGLVVTALVVCIGIALSRTVFFNIQTIEIAGSAPQYTAEDIAKASGVHTGDNMMRLNREETEENVLNQLVFVDGVTVKKSFPDKLVITVTPSNASYNIVDENGTLQISAIGKILRNSPEMNDDLPVVTGYHPETREAGDMLVSKDPQKDQIFQSLKKIMAEDLEYPITSIDLEDKYEIVLTFDGRIRFAMGNWSDMAYKITLAQTVMGQLAEDKTGYLYMIGDNQCSYRDKDAVELQTTLPIVTIATDENGDPIAETDESGNPISTTTETVSVENDWQ